MRKPKNIEVTRVDSSERSNKHRFRAETTSEALVEHFGRMSCYGPTADEATDGLIGFIVDRLVNTTARLNNLESGLQSFERLLGRFRQ